MLLPLAYLLLLLSGLMVLSILVLNWIVVRATAVMTSDDGGRLFGRCSRCAVVTALALVLGLTPTHDRAVCESRRLRRVCAAEWFTKSAPDI